MSGSVLVIGNKNYSSWSMRPWVAMRHLGLDFEEVHVSLFAPGYKAEILRHSPAGRVPVLKQGDLLVWESLAICEHLAEQHPALWPSHRQARAAARSAACEMHAGFGALREAMPMNCRASGRRVERGAAVDQDIRRIQASWTECRERYGSDGPWLFGAFSIADAMYAPVASRFRTYAVECDAVVGEYIDTVLSSAPLLAWYAAAAEETEMIEKEEVG